MTVEAVVVKLRLLQHSQATNLLPLRLVSKQMVKGLYSPLVCSRLSLPKILKQTG